MAKSAGALRVKAQLEREGVDFREEFTFKECRDKRSLPFDFMVIIMVNGKVKMGLIEYDGKQHERITPKFHGHDPIKAQEAFDKQVCHDVTKNLYTKHNGISLLRIMYSDDKRIEELVSEFIREMRRTKQDRVEIFSDPAKYPAPYGSHNWCVLI